MVVSRAEYKLSEAAEAFHFDFRDKVVLDIGSSTGGFTEFALSCGARKVIAVEKGTNQMKAPLRFDKRIELFEKTDIFDVGTRNKKVILNEFPDIVVADVSFVSLRKILTHVKKNLVDFNSDLLVMLKPQFEAEDFQLNRGIVKNEKIRREVIKDFEAWLRRNGFLIIGKHDNETFGKKGNRERFYYLKVGKKSACNSSRLSL